MAEPHLDHPGEITWFAGHGPAVVLGDCPHDGCSHGLLANIAWGPDFEHYVLDECRDPDGCNGRCRAWAEEWPYPYTKDRPKHRLGKFKHVDLALTETG
jgi:hypothetical protein